MAPSTSTAICISQLYQAAERDAGRGLLPAVPYPHVLHLFGYRRCDPGHDSGHQRFRGGAPVHQHLQIIAADTPIYAVSDMGEYANMNMVFIFGGIMVSIFIGHDYKSGYVKQLFTTPPQKAGLHALQEPVLRLCHGLHVHHLSAGRRCCRVPGGNLL